MDVRRYQEMYGDACADIDAIAGTQNYDASITAKSALHTIFVQRISISVTTHADGKSWTFQDSANSPIPIAKYPDEVVADIQEEQPWVVDFGAKGTPLTQGKNLDIKGSAAGLAGRIHIEAYQKLTGVGAP